VVLLSGGLDSATAAADARDLGYSLYALTFDYGQRHAVEIEAAKRVGEALGVEQHVIIPIDLRVFGGSALTSDTRVPKDRSPEEMSDGIPATYVPARNTIFLSYALAWAEVLQSNDIFIGVNCVDYSGYPDCRPEYVAAFQKMGRLATRAGVEGGGTLTIHTPLLTLSKHEIIRRGLELGVDYSLTSSCYDPSDDGKACGRCDACALRKAGFERAGVPDPIEYLEIGRS
jgi:7-cyano-7-deazaguanine synthase